MTKTNDATGGRVFYDGECPLCAGWVGRFRDVLQRAGFTTAKLPSRADRREFTEMVVEMPGGRSFGGAEGLVQIARRVWWAWPLFALAQIPGTMGLLRAGYRRLAVNRHCLDGACRVPSRKSPGRWLPLICLPIAALFLRDDLPGWAFMWTMALALFAGGKWLTFSEARQHSPAARGARETGYLLAWPGMDAAAFLSGEAPVARPRAGEWIPAVTNIVLGATLVWVVARLVLEAHPLLAGWIGMTGVVLLLHFGLFHLLALGWRTAGVNATPLMRQPARACSLAEFWGRRWNTAFHELVHRYTFRPLLRKASARPALLLVFLLSGLVHELVISFPARGGYGLPTGYFLIQGLGVLIERTNLGRRLGLGRGGRGWLFTMFCAAAPACWLFHPPFLHHVILPMLQALGAT